MRVLTGCTVAVMFLLPAASLAVADEERAASVERRVQFNRQVAERDRLHAQLEALDRRAAERMARNEDPVRIHAEQMAVQDRLDRIELRLDVLALRHGFTVPPIRDADAADSRPGSNPDADRATELFDRGRARAQRALRSRHEEFLASIDFRRFLAEAE